MATLVEEASITDKMINMDSEIDVEINDAELFDSASEIQDLDIPEIESQNIESKPIPDNKIQTEQPNVISSSNSVHHTLAAEKTQTAETKDIISVEKPSNLPKELPTATTQPKRLLKLTGNSSTTPQNTQNETLNAKQSTTVESAAKPRMIKLNTTSRSTAITNQAKTSQPAPKITQAAQNKTITPPQQKAKTKTPKTTTPPAGSHTFVLTPSPLGKSDNTKQVPKLPLSETPTPSPASEKLLDAASKSKVVEVATSQRTNGTWRKPVRIRPGYVPPEERSSKLKQKTEFDEDEEEIDIMTDEREADAESDSGQAQKGPKRSAQLMDSDTDEPQRVRPNQGFISRLVNSNFTFNTKILPMSLEDKDLLNDEDGSVERIFNETTTNLLSTIEGMRRLQGIILLKHIAKSYGINIKIEDNEDSENTDISENENNDAAGQATKRRKLTNSMKEAIRKGRQVRIKQVQGAIGYKSA